MSESDSIATTAPELLIAVPKKAAAAKRVVAKRKVSNTETDATTEPVYTKEEKAIMDEFKQLDQYEHILQRPDTYLGSVAVTQKQMHVFDNETNSIVARDIEYIPGFYKLYDEVVVNCRDHIIRILRAIADGTAPPNSKPVTFIKINVTDDGTISATNDGNGVPIALHPLLKIWVPEMIFAHLRSGANFDKKDDDIIGGKNGFGAKLAVVWSSFASIEIVDHISGKHYYQEFKNNRAEICEPVIKSVPKTTKPYTKITYRPDYVRFGMPEGLTADVRALFKKRAYDIAAITDKGIKVYYNDELLPVKNFKEYVDYYVGNKATCPRVYSAVDSENSQYWEYAAALSPNGEFQHVSFVNGIHTSKGGNHVSYITDQIVDKIKTIIVAKKKLDPQSVVVKKQLGAAIRQQLMVFINCNIVNPSFDSQTKEYMNTNVSAFGSKCVVPDEFVDKVAKMDGLIDAAYDVIYAKEKRNMAKTTDGKKTAYVNVEKLDDAEYAGTKKSDRCYLVLTEGDSAKTGFISGLSELTDEERKYFGIYPLKGKTLNVRDETDSAISKNLEITNIMQIMGLKTVDDYADDKNVESLRYGSIIFLTDSDVDGSHIKGLLINLFQAKWPSLYRRKGFLRFMNTPILKATKAGNQLMFYNAGEYERWKTDNPATWQQWSIKYYKGLGTSTKAEWMEYMRDRKFIQFLYVGATSDDKIDMVFRKKRTDERKAWLETYDSSLYVDTTATDEGITYDDFIQKDLIHFSSSDNERSLPSVIDGLKPSQRKILYSAFKRNLTTSIKVAQFAGYVSEHSEYHHGEVSLYQTITGMAQNFIGTNNVNLLYPDGQFGSRIQGGKDAASPRYIFTRLEHITRALFPKHDDAIVHYLEEDGKMIEPLYYVPVLPVLLLNGACGVGTGFMTNTPSFNPREISAWLQNRLRGGAVGGDMEVTFMPYYEGFTGVIQPIPGNTGKFLVKGSYTRVDENTILITEVPVGTWTQTYKEFLTELRSPSKDKDGNQKSKIIDEFVADHSDTIIHITVRFPAGKLAELEAITVADYPSCNGVHKLLKLFTTISTGNMTAFDAQGKIRTYKSVVDILNEYYGVRLEHYAKRKAWLMATLQHDLCMISNRARFILENVNGTIDLRRKRAAEIDNILTQKGYDRIGSAAGEDAGDNAGEDAGDNAGASSKKSYKYLTSMPLISLSAERMEALLREKGNKEAELGVIQNTTPEAFWLHDLNAFDTAYEEFLIQRNEARVSSSKKKGTATAAATSKKAVKRR